MKNFIAIVFLLIAAKTVSAQQIDLTKVADSISTEAETLYRSEWASWHGSDIFGEKCAAQRLRAGGYISYDTGKGLNNVFFSRDAEPQVLATISFGYGLNKDNYKLDTTARKLTPAEKELYTIRQAVVVDINKDTLYKRYQHTNLNPVPIITKKSKVVYVLTGPDINGVVIFGNDYLVTFDKNNNMVAKRHLHKNLIPVTYSKPGADGKPVDIAGMHIHLPQTGDFITATDICTLRLYEKYTTWKQHIVTSKNYASVWDCEHDKLSIMPLADWEKNNSLKSALQNNTH